MLFHRQRALEDDDLRRYATGLGLDVALSDHDRASAAVLERVRRDVDRRDRLGRGTGHPHLVHRRRGVPGRLRRGHLAQDTGPLSAPAAANAALLAVLPNGEFVAIGAGSNPATGAVELVLTRYFQ
jgi:hypothetical protein